MPRRSRLEATLDVLKIIQDGEHKPTRIMNAANLTYRVFREIVSILLSQGLIEEGNREYGSRRRDRRTSIEYEITIEGKNVLKHLKNIDDLIMLDYNSLVDRSGQINFD